MLRGMASALSQAQVNTPFPLLLAASTGSLPAAAAHPSRRTLAPLQVEERKANRTDKWESERLARLRQREAGGGGEGAAQGQGADE